MSSGPLLPTASLAPVFITAVICAIIGALYALLEIEAHLFVEFVLSVAPLVAALIWIRTDARGRRVALVHDLGLFLVIAWPLVIPWYAVKTRGRHAWPLALLILAAILTPALVVWLIGLYKYGLDWQP